ncbi:ribosome-recycling factor [Planctomycetales bacterium]|nr:ribosome-recycling factor [Planctomycetales bacterium]
MPTQKTIKDAQAAMEKTLSHLRKEFTLVRTGRAAPLLVENLSVAAYGAAMPLKQCGAISVPEARQLLIKPFDAGLLKEIEKAIMASELGVNPQNDGKVIRVTFPPLTEERRKKLATEIKAKGEDAKVSLRNVRRDAIHDLDKLQKEKIITEDALKKEKENVQNTLKDYEKKIDAEVAKKTEEIMEI